MVRVDLGNDQCRKLRRADEHAQASHRIADGQRIVVRPVRERDLGGIHHVDIEMHGDRPRALLETRPSLCG